MQLEERLAEAGGEGGSGFGDAAFGARQLRGKAGEEVILALLGRQDRHGRQHAERIGGQEDDVLGSGTGRDAVDLLRDLLNMLDRVADAGILGNALIAEVDLAFCVDGHVL